MSQGAAEQEGEGQGLAGPLCRMTIANTVLLADLRCRALLVNGDGERVYLLNVCGTAIPGCTRQAAAALLGSPLFSSTVVILSRNLQPADDCVKYGAVMCLVWRESMMLHLSQCQRACSCSSHGCNRGCLHSGSTKSMQAFLGFGGTGVSDSLQKAGLVNLSREATVTQAPS